MGNGSILTNRTINFRMKNQLIKLFQDEEKAMAALRIIETDSISVIMEHYAARNRARQCYNPPSYNDLKMHVLNVMLEGYGVEGFQIEDVGDDESYCHYVNMGDTYTSTILLYNGDFKVGCWGDVAEMYNYNAIY